MELKNTNLLIFRSHWFSFRTPGSEINFFQVTDFPRERLSATEAAEESKSLFRFIYKEKTKKQLNRAEISLL